MTHAADTFRALRQGVTRLARDPGDLMGFEGDVKAALEAHDEGSEIGEAVIPEMIRLSLERYRARKPMTVGGTIRLILEGHLGAVTSADDGTFGAIRTIFRWVHNKLPSRSWGSPAKVAAWLKGAKE